VQILEKKYEKKNAILFVFVKNLLQLVFQSIINKKITH